MPSADRDDLLLQRLEAALPRVLEGLKGSHFDRYSFLRSRLFERDVSRDGNFQRTFNGLYRVRRNSEWKGHYYRLMEREKTRASVEFGELLVELYNATGRIEASFVSKLVAIIHPEYAVYDSVVSANLGLVPPRYYDPPALRLAGMGLTYAELNARMNGLIRHPRFPALKVQLAAAFPVSELTDLRVLDLLLWQLRPEHG